MIALCAAPVTVAALPLTLPVTLPTKLEAVTEPEKLALPLELIVNLEALFVPS